MNYRIADFHIHRRAAEFQRMIFCAIFALAACILLPLSPVLATLAAAVFIAPALLSYVRFIRERQGTAAPNQPGDSCGRSKKPRELVISPFPDPFDPANDMPVADRITEAAQASCEFGRTICVLRLDVTPCEGAEAESLIRAIAEVIRPRVRKSDLVALRSDDQIVICLNMARNFDVAELVAARLTRAIMNSGLWPFEQAPQFGRAIYPLNGYCGAGLIEAARHSKA